MHVLYISDTLYLSIYNDVDEAIKDTGLLGGKVMRKKERERL